MKFTTIAADAFQKFQLNAGILLTEFDPANPTVDRSKIFAATGGGTSFTAEPEYIDFGEDVDNVPANTKELKRIDAVTATMSGTLRTADTEVAKRLIGAADVDAQTGKVTPRADLLESDFFDLWWVGDYSDKNGDADGGFLAIKLINALSNGGFSLQSNDKGKGDFEFEFVGHYSLADITKVPYEIYIKQGGEVEDATLSALTVGTLTLTPTFRPSTHEYTATTSNATNTVTATPNDADATVAIDLDGTAVENGSAATWETGENTLEITVTNGSSTSTYTVTVTKE